MSSLKKTQHEDKEGAKDTSNPSTELTYYMCTDDYCKAWSLQRDVIEEHILMTHTAVVKHGGRVPRDKFRFSCLLCMDSSFSALKTIKTHFELAHKGHPNDYSDILIYVSDDKQKKPHGCNLGGWLASKYITALLERCQVSPIQWPVWRRKQNTAKEPKKDIRDATYHVYYCAQCGFKHFQLQLVRQHIVSHFPQIHVFSCMFCEFGCPDRCSFDRHLTAKHNTKSIDFNFNMDLLQKLRNHLNENAKKTTQTHAELLCAQPYVPTCTVNPFLTPKETENDEKSKSTTVDSEQTVQSKSQILRKKSADSAVVKNLLAKRGSQSNSSSQRWPGDKKILHFKLPIPNLLKQRKLAPAKNGSSTLTSMQSVGTPAASGSIQEKSNIGTLPVAPVDDKSVIAFPSAMALSPFSSIPNSNPSDFTLNQSMPILASPSLASLPQLYPFSSPQPLFPLLLGGNLVIPLPTKTELNPTDGQSAMKQVVAETGKPLTVLPPVGVMPTLPVQSGTTSSAAHSGQLGTTLSALLAGPQNLTVPPISVGSQLMPAQMPLVPPSTNIAPALPDQNIVTTSSSLLSESPNMTISPISVGGQILPTQLTSSPLLVQLLPNTLPTSAQFQYVPVSMPNVVSQKPDGKYQQSLPSRCERNTSLDVVVDTSSSDKALDLSVSASQGPDVVVSEESKDKKEAHQSQAVPRSATETDKNCVSSTDEVSSTSAGSFYKLCKRRKVDGAKLEFDSADADGDGDGASSPGGWQVKREEESGDGGDELIHGQPVETDQASSPELKIKAEPIEQNVEAGESLDPSLDLSKPCKIPKVGIPVAQKINKIYQEELTIPGVVQRTRAKTLNHFTNLLSSLGSSSGDPDGCNRKPDIVTCQQWPSYQEGMLGSTKSGEKEENKIFGCMYCFQLHEVRAEMESHIQHHHCDITPYLCEPCCKQFVSLTDLINHYQQTHIKKRQLSKENEISPLLVCNSRLLLQSIRVKTSYVVLDFQECLVEFQSSKDSYYKSITSYKCNFPRCLAHHLSYYPIKKHIMMKHEINSVNIFNCVYCKYGSMKLANVKRHASLKHPSDKFDVHVNNQAMTNTSLRVQELIEHSHIKSVSEMKNVIAISQIEGLFSSPKSYDENMCSWNSVDTHHFDTRIVFHQATPPNVNLRQKDNDQWGRICIPPNIDLNFVDGITDPHDAMIKIEPQDEEEEERDDLEIKNIKSLLPHEQEFDKKADPSSMGGESTNSGSQSIDPDTHPAWISSDIRESTKQRLNVDEMSGVSIGPQPVAPPVDTMVQNFVGYFCKLCNYVVFADKDEAREHVCTEHQDLVDSVYACIYCDHMSYTLTQLKVHSQVAHPKTSMRYAINFEANSKVNSCIGTTCIQNTSEFCKLTVSEVCRSRGGKWTKSARCIERKPNE